MSQQQLKEPLGNSEVPVKACSVAEKLVEAEGREHGGQKAMTSLPTQDRRPEIRLIRAGFIRAQTKGASNMLDTRPAGRVSDAVPSRGRRGVRCPK